MLAKLNGKLRNAYEELKEQYLQRLFKCSQQELAKLIPKGHYRSHFVCMGGSYEVTYIIGKWLPPPPAKALVVGVYGGRDYFYLKSRGYDVVGLDISKIEAIDRLVIANAEEFLPFKRGCFDIVICAEVLEHLAMDIKCLENISEVLAKEGVLIITIPYYNDASECHLRIYSPKTIQRLLNAGGYEVVDYIERPGLLRWPGLFNNLNHLLNLFLLRLFGVTIYQFVLPILSSLECFLGRKKIPLRRLSTGFGAYILCRQGKRVDYIALNQRKFSSCKER